MLEKLEWFVGGLEQEEFIMNEKEQNETKTRLASIMEELADITKSLKKQLLEQDLTSTVPLEDIKLYKLKIPEFEIMVWAKNKDEAYHIAQEHVSEELHSVTSKLKPNKVQKVKSWEDIDDDNWNSYSSPWGDNPDLYQAELKDYIGLKPGHYAKKEL